MPHKRKGTKGTKGIEGRKAIYGITDMKLVKTNISQLKVAFMPFMEMLIDRLSESLSKNELERTQILFEIPVPFVS